MRDKTYTLHTVLAAVVGLACLAALVLRTLLPAAVLPAPDLPTLSALAIIALVLEAYLVPHMPPRPWVITALVGAIAFGFLPLAAGLIAADDLLLFVPAGGVLFTVLTFLFSSLRERLSSGPSGRLAPLFTGFVLFLACRCLMGLFL